MACKLNKNVGKSVSATHQAGNDSEEFDKLTF